MKQTLIILSIAFFSFSNHINDFIKVKLPRQVSSDSEQELAPYINMNGDQILYSVKDSHASTWSLELAKKYKGEWKRGIEVDPINQSKKLNLIGGYAINPTGDVIIFSSKKRGGIGSYDLWETRLKNGTWSTPTNLGKPVNSNLNDAAPSFSRDGNQIYFMRCQSLNNNQCQNCALFSSRLKNNYWSEPSPIKIESNPKNPSFPKIGSDDNTLYFYSENRVQVSKRVGETWEKPTQIEYLSTKGNDYYYSLSKQSNKIYFSEQGEHTNDLFVGQLSLEHRAVQLTELRIIAKSNTGSLKSELSLYNTKNNKFISKTESKDNGRLAILVKPGQYIYLLQTEDEKGFYIDTLHINNPETFKAILRKPDLSPIDSLYLHTGGTKHNVFDKLFYKGLTSSIKSREISDTVQVHTPTPNFFSQEFYERLNKSKASIKIVIDSCLKETQEVLVVY